MLILVVDTNLFHEFLALDQLPWRELGEQDLIRLIVTDPVQTELDEHKKSNNSRLKRRAIELTKRFRGLVLSDSSAEEIQEQNPRVLIEIDDTALPEGPISGLDLSVPDDQIVAIAKAIQDQNPDQQVHVFADDLRPLRTAKRAGLIPLEIPDSWRRPNTKTEDEKERDKLQAEIVRLRRAEPLIELKTECSSPLRFELPSFQPLGGDQIEDLVEALQVRYPLETDFERACDRDSMGLPHMALTLAMKEFVPATEEKINNYTKRAYPEWVEHCREMLKDAHTKLAARDWNMMSTVVLTNEGTRPAEDLLISFEASGPLQIVPDRKVSKDEAKSHPLGFKSPPDAPQGHWRDISSLAALMHSNLGLSGLVDAARYHSRMPNLDGLNQRDPNAFYYRDGRPTYPTKAFSLTCEQFRHSSQEEFATVLSPTGSVAELDGKSALVRVRCEAANLSDPVVSSLPVKFMVKDASIFDEVIGLIKSDAFDAHN